MQRGSPEIRECSPSEELERALMFVFAHPDPSSGRRARQRHEKSLPSVIVGDEQMRGLELKPRPLGNLGNQGFFLL